MKNKLKDIYIYNWVYNTDLVVVWGDYGLLKSYCEKILPKEKFEEQKKYLEENIESTSKGRQYRFTGGGSLIWMKEWNVMTLLHEIIHYAQWIADQRSIPMVSETDEVFAYLIENTYKRVCEIYKEKYKK
jgi:hypothetical protein